MNLYDSIKMESLLQPFGYEQTSAIEQADVIILNTCHIREKASEKVYSELGRIKKLKDNRKHQNLSDIIIVVAGCTAQAEGNEIFTRAPYVDIVVGPQSYHSLPELVQKIARHERHLINLDFVLEEKFDKLPEETINHGPSSCVSIQEGCDKFCTFCVVPYTRGAEFSRPLEAIYREVLQMTATGAKEINLLGQNVNAYHGKDPDGNIRNIVDLIQYIAQIPNLARIRYTTSHPMDMTQDLIKLHATESKLLPFLHLPIQSGSNKILKAMNRKHDRDYYLSIINDLRIARSDIVLSSDFIVGFPGETDEDFADTLDLVKKVGYGQCYSFKYSPRPGTPAATKQQVPEAVKTTRLAILQTELQKQQFEFNKTMVGKVVPVLFDRDGKFDGQSSGKTPYMQSVHVKTQDCNLYGTITDVVITDALATSLAGEIIPHRIQKSA